MCVCTMAVQQTCPELYAQSDGQAGRASSDMLVAESPCVSYC